MEKARKSLKFMSEIILICLTFSFVRSILEIFLTKVTNNDNDKYYIFVHLYLNEFRKYEILHETYLRLIHDYTI